MTDTNSRNLEEMVVDFVEERQGVTFVELERLLEDEIDVEGGQTLVADADSNINFWVNVSEEFVDLIVGLLNDERLYVHPTQPMTYIIDGRVPKMEVAKQPPADGYKSERWLPVALYTYDPYKEDDR